MGQLKAAEWPREDRLAERLLHANPSAGSLTDARLANLTELLRRGDLIVLNDAATLPASLHTSDGLLEVRLLCELDREDRWRAVVFGAGDFGTRTEHRPAPPRPRVGQRLVFAHLEARVTFVDDLEPRLVEIEFGERGAGFWSALYRSGRPVQYAHVKQPLELWHVQTAFAARPWAVEMPSAGRPLTFGLLSALRERGVRLSIITHAAGLSSLGGAAIDRRLPLAESYADPVRTAELVTATHRAGGRVVAMGPRWFAPSRAPRSSTGGCCPVNATPTGSPGPGSRRASRPDC
jgi:S-adenosylmethionine:tRNA ribosyltransferase-isomerase